MSYCDKDLFEEFITPRVKLEIVEDRIADLKKMLMEVSDDLYYEELKH